MARPIAAEVTSSLGTDADAGISTASTVPNASAITTMMTGPGSTTDMTTAPVTARTHRIVFATTMTGRAPIRSLSAPPCRVSSTRGTTCTESTAAAIPGLTRAACHTSPDTSIWVPSAVAPVPASQTQ